MPQLLKNLTIHEISLVDEPDNDEARVVIVKARGRQADLNLGDSADDPQENEMDIEAIQAALTEAEETIGAIAKARDAAEAKAAQAEARIAALEAEIAKAKPAADDEEAIFKALPEAFRKRLAEAEAAAARAVAEKEESEAIAKARPLVESDDEARSVGLLLLRIRKGATDAADAETVEAILKAARAIDKTTVLFKNLGSAAAGEAKDKAPEAVIAEIAAEIRKAKPDLTEAQAAAEAWRRNPELYDAFSKSRRPAA